VFAGLRPLVDPTGGEGETSAISREHVILVPPSGLVTIAGGKWTTYRKMAEDVVDHAAVLGGLESRPCPTRELNIHGYHLNADRFGDLAFYGADAPEVQALQREDPGLAERIHPRLPVTGAQVVWAVREEMARRVDDVLARRTRALLFDAAAALEAAPEVARLMAVELEQDRDWEAEEVEAFRGIAAGYLL
jgi:glycerol-3-phosphate dehydrogenase